MVAYFTELVALLWALVFNRRRPVLSCRCFSTYITNLCREFIKIQEQLASSVRRDGAFAHAKRSIAIFRSMTR